MNDSHDYVVFILLESVDDKGNERKKDNFTKIIKDSNHVDEFKELFQEFKEEQMRDKYKESNDILENFLKKLNKKKELYIDLNLTKDKFVVLEGRKYSHFSFPAEGHRKLLVLNYKKKKLNNKIISS
ncbi:hypothetical protein CPAV1605_326 [seawater metagenome]|uniref:Uncharacterized protein n=1 Tax=seawater metagenome TaxID=1561972 RepID=A0A5E8CHB9_9ZZZZ